MNIHTTWPLAALEYVQENYPTADYAEMREQCRILRGGLPATDSAIAKQAYFLGVARANRPAVGRPQTWSAEADELVRREFPTADLLDLCERLMVLRGRNTNPGILRTRATLLGVNRDPATITVNARRAAKGQTGATGISERERLGIRALRDAETPKRTDNPVRHVPPGTYAVRGFTMLDGRVR